MPSYHVFQISNSSVAPYTTNDAVQEEHRPSPSPHRVEVRLHELSAQASAQLQLTCVVYQECRCGGGLFAGAVGLEQAYPILVLSRVAHCLSRRCQAGATAQEVVSCSSAAENDDAHFPLPVAFADATALCSMVDSCADFTLLTVADMQSTSAKGTHEASLSRASGSVGIKGPTQVMRNGHRQQSTRRQHEATTAPLAVACPSAMYRVETRYW